MLFHILAFLAPVAKQTVEPNLDSKTETDEQETEPRGESAEDFLKWSLSLSAHDSGD